VPNQGRRASLHLRRQRLVARPRPHPGIPEKLGRSPSEGGDRRTRRPKIERAPHSRATSPAWPQLAPRRRDLDAPAPGGSSPSHAPTDMAPALTDLRWLPIVADPPQPVTDFEVAECGAGRQLEFCIDFENSPPEPSRSTWLRAADRIHDHGAKSGTIHNPRQRFGGPHWLWGAKRIPAVEKSARPRQGFSVAAIGQ